MEESHTISARNGWVESDVRLENKTVLITGGNSGIGFETAKDLAGRGARVILACRNMEAGETAKKQICEEFPQADVIVGNLDLASLESIRAFAENIINTQEKLNILINNAGVMYSAEGKTKDGFEMQIGVNHIGHFLLTNLLLDLIKKSAPSRIIVVSSWGYKSGKMNWNDLMHERTSPGNFPIYFHSKLCTNLFANELSRRLEGTQVTCNILCPGLVRTNLGRHMRGQHVPFFQRLVMNLTWPIFQLMAKSAQNGAQTSIYCAIAPELEGVTGKYYTKCAEEEQLPHALNEDDAKRLWEQSERWCGISSVDDHEEAEQKTSE